MKIRDAHIHVKRGANTLCMSKETRYIKINTSKETHIYVKRDPHIWIKKTHIYVQTDPYIRQKRFKHTSKETQIYAKRDPPKETNIKVKRDTDISIKKNNKAHKGLVGFIFLFIHTFIFLFYSYMSCNKAHIRLLWCAGKPTRKEYTNLVKAPIFLPTSGSTEPPHPPGGFPIYYIS